MALDSEVEWFETILEAWLDKFAQIIQVSTYFKKWLNDEVAQAKKTRARDKKD